MANVLGSNRKGNSSKGENLVSKLEVIRKITQPFSLYFLEEFYKKGPSFQSEAWESMTFAAFCGADYHKGS